MEVIIIHIDGAFTKAALMNSEKFALNVIPFEIIISEATVVEYLGMHSPEEAKPDDIPTDVNFETIIDAEGLICIKGYVKTKFSLSSGRFDTMSYGCGAITDGVNKLTIQISNFKNLMKIEKGVFITVIGTIVNKDGFIKVFCKDDSSITPDDKEPLKSPEFLIRGSKNVVALKRKVPEE